MLRNPWNLGDPQTKQDRIRIGYLTLAFSEGRGEAANSDFVPLCLGIPNDEGVTQHVRPLLGPRQGRSEGANSDFVPLCLATPENLGGYIALMGP